jgi:hypothetical protein
MGAAGEGEVHPGAVSGLLNHSYRVGRTMFWVGPASVVHRSMPGATWAGPAPLAATDVMSRSPGQKREIVTAYY